MDMAALMAQLRPEEGCKLFPYPDNGDISIGWGHNLTRRGIPQAVADLLFQQDVQDTAAELAHALPWVEQLDPVRQRVLGDMAYNDGLGGLLGFHKMLAAAQAGDFETAAAELLDSKVAREEDPERYQHLAQMLRTGQVAA